MSLDKLLEERNQLQTRLNWLGVRSTGSERIEKRIREIDMFVEGVQRRARPPDGLVEARQA